MERTEGNALKRAAWIQAELRKTGLAAFGLFVCAFGSYLQVQAGIGLSPWNALNQGAAVRFGVTYGTAAAVLSALVLLLDLALGEGVGAGSVLDALVVGRCVDGFTDMGLVVRPETLAGQAALLLAGLSVSAVGVALYMRAGLCCGPRDTLMVALGKRMRRMPIGVVNFLIFLLVFVVSVLLGCTVGVGTVIATLANGPILQLVFRIAGFDPRGISHESFRTMLLQYRALCP